MSWLERQWYRITPLHILLIPVSLLFGLLSAIRRFFYRTHILSSEKLPVPVIVAGNISVGGSGKTPLTLWLAQQLCGEGWHPGIVSRGYRGKTSFPRAVTPTDSADSVGDEPLLMAQRHVCPVWIGKDRAAAAQALLQAHPECDVILSDDGLQHYRLRRDFEIVVVDGVRRFGNGLLLPAGPLREPPSRLKNVDAIVINNGEARDAEYRMQLVGSVFHNLLNPGTVIRPQDLQGLRLHAIAGIGHPQRFFEHLFSLGLEIRPHPFPDHYRFIPDDLAFAEADAILMTEKDAVKCASFATEKYWVLRVDAQIDPALTQYVLERIAPDG
jgi:tetraacyldisaccharide 4'-kinase